MELRLANNQLLLNALTAVAPYPYDNRKEALQVDVTVRYFTIGETLDSLILHRVLAKRINKLRAHELTLSWLPCNPNIKEAIEEYFGGSE